MSPRCHRPILALALLTLGCAASPRRAPSLPPRVALAWLRGTWCGPMDGGEFCETWRDDGDALAGDGALRLAGGRRSDLEPLCASGPVDLATLGAHHDLDLHHRELVDTTRAWLGRSMAYKAVWDQDWAALFAAVRCPMLLLCATDDVLYPYFERAQALRPDATAVVIKGANFEPDLDAAGTVAAITGFLDGAGRER